MYENILGMWYMYHINVCGPHPACPLLQILQTDNFWSTTRIKLKEIADLLLSSV